MARHTQLEMADIDLREVDGVFSDGEYTRARPLSPARNDATTDELHPCCPVQAVWSALRWPRAREACGGV
jgi:hypothetical protein